ncbi:hypothetical protein BDQ17DRAFT_1168252, partial [Cyathus striatus]
HIDHMGKSRSNKHWTTVYPSSPPPPGRVVHSLLLINSSISTDSWSPVPLPSSDITAIRLQVVGGHSIFIFNLY